MNRTFKIILVVVFAALAAVVSVKFWPSDSGRVLHFQDGSTMTELYPDP